MSGQKNGKVFTMDQLREARARREAGEARQVPAATRRWMGGALLVTQPRAFFDWSSVLDEILAFRRASFMGSSSASLPRMSVGLQRLSNSKYNFGYGLHNVLRGASQMLSPYFFAVEQLDDGVIEGRTLTSAGLLAKAEQYTTQPADENVLRMHVALNYVPPDFTRIPKVNAKEPGLFTYDNGIWHPVLPSRPSSPSPGGWAC